MFNRKKKEEVTAKASELGDSIGITILKPGDAVHFPKQGDSWYASDFYDAMDCSFLISSHDAASKNLVLYTTKHF
jgi:hypothetical protein